MRYHVGTSGYSYKEWKGGFYPEKLPQKQMLNFYSQKLSTVEVNYTFRMLPSAKTVENWAQQVPESFRFVLKAQQRITHFKRLKDAEQYTDEFLNIAALLKKRQGPLLFQLPPNFQKDVPRLDAFLKHVDGRAALALEFRHVSWFDNEVYDCLRAHSAALCISDEVDGLPTDVVRTANWGYLRLREGDYTDKSLRAWIKKLEDNGFQDAYVFFMHEDVGGGPRLAARLLELTGQ